MPNAFIIADLKTLDVGKLEVDFAFNATADAVVCSGLANDVSIEKFLKEARRVGICGVIDLMEVSDPVGRLSKLKVIPDMVILHKGIDTEATKMDPKLRWAPIPKIKELYKTWNRKFCKGQFIYNVGLHDEPYFKYFNYEDFLTPYSGLSQIRKYAEINGKTDLLEQFEIIKKTTKKVKDGIYDLLVNEFHYFK